MTATIDPKFVGAAIASRLHTIKQQEPIHRRILDAFGPNRDLHWADWVALSATVAAYCPEIILELGRGAGTSTALFRLTKVPLVSICLTEIWAADTVPRLHQIEPIDWMQGVTAIVGEITKQDYGSLIAGARRVMIFWDAHGFEVADTVLGTLLPILIGRDVLMACHDLRDSRYFLKDREYRTSSLWRRQGEPDSAWVHLGHVHSSFEQIVSIVDFTSRNGIELHSATHSIMMNSVARAAFHDPQWPYCYWHYFELPKRRDLTFPVSRGER